MTGKIIVVGGPPAVGKSTVVRAVQRTLVHTGEMWIVVSFDSLAQGIPLDWFSLRGHAGANAARGITYEREADGSLTMRVGEDARRAFAGFRRGVAALASSGINVVCEATTLDATDWNDWPAALTGLEVVMVLLTAPMATLDAREAADPTRLHPGLARGLASTYATLTADLLLDTTEHSAREAAAVIADACPWNTS